jgi:hypothetical protein
MWGCFGPDHDFCPLSGEPAGTSAIAIIKSRRRRWHDGTWSKRLAAAYIGMRTHPCDAGLAGTEGAPSMAARRGNTVRHQERLVQQLQELGYAVTLRKVA